MKTTLTAAAYFAFAMMGPAFAGEISPAVTASVSASDVLNNIYTAMDKDRAETEGAVVASAESRLSEQLAALDAQPAPAPAITIASN